MTTATKKRGAKTAKPAKKTRTSPGRQTSKASTDEKPEHSEKTLVALHKRQARIDRVLGVFNSVIAGADVELGEKTVKTAISLLEKLKRITERRISRIEED